MLADSDAVRILLVEDNSIDVRIVKRAMREAGMPCPVVVARDGIEALAILRGASDAAPCARPIIVLLDLNMPRVNGFELLAELRADPVLHDLVVFVLTTSDAPEDKQRAYGFNIAGYLLKSDVGRGFQEVMAMLDRFAHVVRLPA